jgi:pheromone shutdown-related protein TraB
MRFPFTTPRNIAKERHKKERCLLEHQNIKRINIGDKEIILIGTAHVSRDSVDLVEQTIDLEKPDTVCVELCKPRYDAIRQKAKWQDTDILKVIKEKRTGALLSQLIMASMQKKIAQKFHVTPGEEMLRAIDRAEANGAEIVLADREIRITLLRAWRMMGFCNKMKFIPDLILSFFSDEEITEEEVEKLKQQDVLEYTLKTIGEKLPRLKEILIDERDLYLAQTIGHAPGNRIVAVVGAGHVPGITGHLGKEIDLTPLNHVPDKGIWGKISGWIFSLAIVGIFAAGFFFSGSAASLKMIGWWSAITAFFAATGAAIMLAHPLTIAASALAAPITTLHPLIAAGWVAGLVEATFRKPQVKDFLALPDDIVSIRGFFHNRITRLLLLVAVVNLTTSVGTFLAIPVIMKFL